MDYTRKQQILNYMKTKQYVTVNELCNYLFVSGATVRRELKELEDSRQIRRTRGGAYLVEGITNETPYILRERQSESDKQIIANQALEYIRDGMTLFLDSSSTIYVLGQNLETFNSLCIITNNLKLSAYLATKKNIKLMCTGGDLYPGTMSLVGQTTVDYIRRHNADAAFLSAQGFSISGGTTESREEEYFIKRAFLTNSNQKYLLCDTSKLGKDYLCKTAELSEFTRVITENREVNKKLMQINHHSSSIDNHNY